MSTLLNCTDPIMNFKLHYNTAFHLPLCVNIAHSLTSLWGGFVYVASFHDIRIKGKYFFSASESLLTLLLIKLIYKFKGIYILHTFLLTLIVQKNVASVFIKSEKNLQ